MNKNTLKKDMKQLAKLVYELSKKHGDIYISATRVSGSKLSSVTYGEDLEDADYWHKSKVEAQG